MVERSTFNLNTDPGVRFPETPFSMALSGSLPSSGSGTFGHEFFLNPVLELNRSLNPSSETHEYLSWKSSDSANTYLLPTNPAVTTSKDPFLVGQYCYSVPANPFEAKPYYPSYFSSATHGNNCLVSPSDSWSAYQSANLDGSSHGVYAKKSIDSNPTPECGGWKNEWRNGWTDWKQGKSNATNLFGSFSSKETNVTGSANYENLVYKGGGDYDTQALSNSVEYLNSNSINMHGGEKPNIIVRAHQTDDRWFIGNDCFSLQAGLSSQTQPALASELPADSGNHQMSYNASCSKPLSQCNKPYSFTTGSSGAKTGMLNDLYVGGASEVTDFRSSSSFTMSMPCSSLSFENQAFLNSCENCIHMEKNWFTSLGNGSEATKKVVPEDSLAHTFLENYGHDISHTSADFQSNRSVSSAVTSFDTIDEHNAAIDSPCWKGSPTTICIPSMPSNEREHLKDSFEVFMGSSMISIASEASASDGIMKGGLCSRVQVPTDTHEGTAVHAVATNIVEEFNSVSFTTEQQCSAKLNITTEEKHSPNHHPADTGIKECSTSERIEILAAKCALSSPTSPIEVPSRSAESILEESPPKVDVQILVKTMQNLSEFLSFHCLNGSSELTEHDQDLLKNVINNINACLLKHVTQIAPEKEIAFSRSDTLQFFEASVEDQQIKGSGEPHLTKEMSEISQSQHGNPNVEVTEQYGKFRESITESLYARDTTKRMKEDTITKELKRILDENFEDEEITDRQALLYRNLWLEAEATLCSNNYKARFNRIMNEMDKCSHQLEENTGGTKKLPNPGVLPNSGEESRLSTEAKHGLCYDASSPNVPTSNTTKHVNDVLVRFHILNIREDESYIKDSNEEDPSDCRSLTDRNKADGPTDLEEKSAKPFGLFQGTLFSGSEDMSEDVEGVIARFNILKSRADHLSRAKNDRPLITEIGEDEMVDAEMDKITVLQGSYTVDKMSIPQEPYFTEEEQGSQFFEQFDIWLPSSSNDGTSSDWEHVTNEEFAGECFLTV